MSIFQSSATINKSVSEVYSFLADMNNHQQLMPEGVTEWKSTTDTASFMVQGMVKLSLKVAEKTENTIIRILPSEKPPFDIELKWAMVPSGNQTIVTYTLSAELNMMMKMMASGPLQKLADHEVNALAKILA